MDTGPRIGGDEAAPGWLRRVQQKTHPFLLGELLQETSKTVCRLDGGRYSYRSGCLNKVCSAGHMKKRHSFKKKAWRYHFPFPELGHLGCESSESLSDRIDFPSEAIAQITRQPIKVSAINADADSHENSSMTILARISHRKFVAANLTTDCTTMGTLLSM